MQKLGMMIGNFFIPMVSKAMLYINGLAVAVQKILATFGVNISSATTSIGQANDNMSDLLDDIDSSADGLADASDNAKKLKNNLMGIDELNVLSQDSGSTSTSASGLDTSGTDALNKAFDDAIENYQKAWDEAYSNLENKIDGISQKIKGAFDTALGFIKNGEWKSLGDWIGTELGNGLNTLMDKVNPGSLADTVNGIALTLLSSINSFIDTVDWDGIGTKIGEFIKDIKFMDILSEVGKLVWKAVNASIETWEGCFDVAPIETTIITAVALLKFTGLGSIIATKIGRSIVTELSVGLATFKTNIGFVIENLFSGLTVKESFTAVFGSLATTIAGVASVIGGVILTVKEFIDMWVNGWSLIKTILEALGIALGVIGAVLLGADIVIAGIIGGVIFGVSQIAILIHDNWDAIAEWTSNLWEKIKGIISPITAWVNDTLITPITTFFTGLGERIAKIFEGCWIIVQAVWKLASPFFNALVSGIKKKFKDDWDEIARVFSKAWDVIKKVWDKVEPYFSVVADSVQTVFDGLGTGIGDVFKGIANGIAGVFEFVINGIINNLNDILGGFNKIVTVSAKIIGADWSGVELIPTISIPRYATGGTPENGLFYANDGEMVGGFSNGRTAVANNGMIVDGIEGGVERAVVRSLQPYLEKLVSSNETIASKDMSVDIDGRELVTAMNRRSTRNGYAFT